MPYASGSIHAVGDVDVAFINSPAVCMYLPKGSNAAYIKVGSNGGLSTLAKFQGIETRDTINRQSFSLNFSISYLIE